jgi:lipoprotein-releasing system permease protein
MYKLLLILKYLRKRRIAWVALLAVTLCTTMVLVVISVMGGWLDMFEHSFQGLTGDVIVESAQDSLTGFPHYQEMIGELLKLPSVEAAVPTIHTFGIINFASPSRPNVYTVGVQVMGVPIDTIGTVNRFPESLYLQHNQYLDLAKAETDPKKKQAWLDMAAAGAKASSFKLPLPAPIYEQGWNGRGSDPATYPGMIAGSAVLGIHRNSDGQTVNRSPELYRLHINLTTIAIRPGERSVDPNDKNETSYWLADDSHTGMWQYDNAFVYVPFDRLQNDLAMGQSETEDAVTHEKHIEPSRTSDIHVKIKPGYDLAQAGKDVEAVCVRVIDSHARDDDFKYGAPTVETWRQKQHVWIDAIQNEKLLTVILFGIISLVAIFLVFCIFYMIVMEKTKDIGIIKSVGATPGGVAQIFLGYGLAIGLVGSGLGWLCSYLIVHNINELHAWLGQIFHVQIWNPEVYLFDKIPNTMSIKDIAIILPIAIVSSVLGALIPAWRASQMHPVESLRWE